MRQAEISRNTLETRITVRLNLDGTGQCRLATGVPFLDHMLDQVARHGLIDLEVEADGDLHQAHDFQTKMLQDEARGNAIPLNIILVHAQDHLTGAILVRDLADEFIEINKRLANADQA